jgi:hypothetical protein
MLNSSSISFEFAKLACKFSFQIGLSTKYTLQPYYNMLLWSSNLRITVQAWLPLPILPMYKTLIIVTMDPKSNVIMRFQCILWMCLLANNCPENIFKITSIPRRIHSHIKFVYDLFCSKWCSPLVSWLYCANLNAWSICFNILWHPHPSFFELNEVWDPGPQIRL